MTVWFYHGQQLCDVWVLGQWDEEQMGHITNNHSERGSVTQTSDTDDTVRLVFRQLRLGLKMDVEAATIKHIYNSFPQNLAFKSFILYFNKN